ncbi:hypothetical protein ABMA28_001900 [Loxostege sticticalis]|uniref:Mos1 transposase HTH domain-containing protein n=1 Tax=Loxostege sticticalis TaxID=481309 RepID=A0ABD0SZB9_LOXSC
MEKNEQRAVIKYLCLKKMSTKEFFLDIQQTLGDHALPYSTVAYWVAEFKRGRSTCEDDQRTGRPSTSVTEENVKKVEKMVLEDRRITIKYLAETLKISFGSIQSILTNSLGFKKVSARWVPRMLTEENKKRRLEISKRNLEMLTSDPDEFCHRVVTMDETWVHHFDPETKRQSMSWKRPSSPPIKKFRVAPTAGTIMASVFWDSDGILFIDYVPKGQTITGPYYASLIPKVREAIKKTRRGKLSSGVLFLHDNAPAHRSEVALQAIHSAGFEMLDHPPYSSDLAPSDFHLFPKFKEHIRGTKFADDDAVMAAVNDFFESQEKDFFLDGKKNLEKRYSKCIKLEGDYVEK